MQGGPDLPRSPHASDTTWNQSGTPSTIFGQHDIATYLITQTSHLSVVLALLHSRAPHPIGSRCFCF